MFAASLPQRVGTSRLDRRPTGRSCSRVLCTIQQPARVDDSEASTSTSPKPPSSRWKASTTSIHAGERSGRDSVLDSLTTPVCMTSTYHFKNSAELIAFQEGKHTSFEYGRYGNPTTRAVEKKIAALELAEDALLSASGMCTATTMLLALVPAGGHIVTTTDCYRRTRQFIQTMLPKMGITTTVIDPSDLVALGKALDDHKVSLFFSESPTNPYLRCVDVKKISEMCRAKGAIVCIDSTFATPVNQTAIVLGADLVIHSATKCATLPNLPAGVTGHLRFDGVGGACLSTSSIPRGSRYLGGHNDVLAGAIAGRADLVQAVRQLHNVLGGVIDPHAAYLVLRGMKTLSVRVERQNQTALRLAAVLEKHPRIKRVHYPGLPSHQDHAIAVEQMTGFGGVISFEVDGDLWQTAKFIDGCQLPYIAPSLGGVESLIEQPTIISYWDQGPEKRAEIGIKDNLVRFSCGIEDYQDIESDLLQSLDSL